MSLRENIYQIKEEVTLALFNNSTSKKSKEFSEKLEILKEDDDEYGINSKIDELVTEISHLNKLDEINTVFNNFIRDENNELSLNYDDITIINSENANFKFLQTYINEILNTKKDVFEFLKDSINSKITFVYTKTGNLQKGNPKKNEPQNIFTQLRRHFKTNQHTPVITISTEDLINISEQNSEKYEYFTKFKIDRRFRFLDSSIWNYYLPLNDNFENRLGEILEEIEKNYKNELYNTAAAKEFIELHYRIAKNSYLINTEAHGDYVAPFVFHSESKMKQMADEKLQKLKDRVKDYKGKIIWNILFIDDYSENNLRGATGKNKTKTDIVKNILKKDGLIKDSEKHDECRFEINFGTTPGKNVLGFVKDSIIEGQTQTEKKVYDILFLDYLLGTKENTSEREYGYEFFTKKYKELAGYKRPLGKFWIFPVTVFTSAMFDRLREQGVSRLDDDWFIASGADPVNTPELFKYNFYSLLEQQLSKAIFTKEDILKFLKQNPLIDAKTEKKDEEVRLWAKQVFGSFIHKFGKREILETDADKGSEFANTVLKYLHETQKNDFRFYDHIRQLLYLLAYGTGFHATQMWELVNFVDYEIFINSENNDEKLKETFRDLIPKYITNLSKFNS